MAAELSLIMANQAKAGPSKLVYDPFVGTGSMLYTSAWFGARVMGSDIDGRHIRGGKGKGVLDSAEQYGVRDRVTDCLVFDLNLAPWRIGEIFDA
jgi:tRNA (guanine10-N2)-methyltransferase